MSLTDVVILGGGPAGVSAALSAIHRGKTACIATSAPEDSPLWRAERVDNYPGLPNVSGRELVQTLLAHAERSGAAVMRGRALSVLRMGTGFGVSVEAEFIQARALVLTTGLAQAAEFPGERAYLGAGVSYCVTCDGMLFRGKRVAVIGLSADAPGEAAYLRSIGCEVEYFDPARAKKYEIRGRERVETLWADGLEWAVSGVFILRPGVAPDALIEGLDMSGGHIRVDAGMATSVPGVFAAGDCTGAPYQVAKAVGEGNIAGIAAAKYVESKLKEE